MSAYSGMSLLVGMCVDFVQHFRDQQHGCGCEGQHDCARKHAIMDVLRGSASLAFLISECLGTSKPTKTSWTSHFVLFF